MKALITLNLLLFSIFNATAQLTFTEIPIMPGSGSSGPAKLTTVNSTMYFQAGNSTDGVELWATDGTPAGTRLVKDIYPGIASSNPRYFTPFNGKTYFIADNTPMVSSLWVTDGTTSGTVLVKQRTLADSIFYEYMGVTNGKLCLTVGSAATGVELWESDGTSAGTKLLKDINSGGGNSYPGPFVAYNGKLYFRAYDGISTELWCTDGTTAGTVTVSSIIHTNAVISDLCVLNNSLYFTATNTTGRVLYKSDGTNAGTMPVVILNTNTGYQSIYTTAAIIDNKLYFASDKGNSDMQLWVTDGTAAGTIKLIEVQNTSTSGFVSNITGYNGKAYFIYHDNWDHIYSTDGTAAGTKEAEAFTKFAAGIPFDFVLNLTVYNGSLYFVANSGYYGTTQLYAITPDAQVLNIKPTGNTVQHSIYPTIQNLHVFNNKLFANASFNSNEGYELWSIEGTPTTISNAAAKAVQAFTLYPNPATSVLHITNANTYKHASITLTNAIGQVVLTKNIDNNNTVSLQGIAPGNYNATIDADSIHETQKLIIQ